MYKKILDYKIYSPSLVHNYGLSFEMLDNFDKAIEVYKSNIQRIPTYVKSKIGIAVCLKLQSKYTKSLNLTLIEKNSRNKWMSLIVKKTSN